MATQTPEITITVEARKGRGTGDAGRMRHKGRVPAVLYGGDKPPVAISVDERAVREILKGAAAATLYGTEASSNSKTRMKSALQ